MTKNTERDLARLRDFFFQALIVQFSDCGHEPSTDLR